MSPRKISGSIEENLPNRAWLGGQAAHASAKTRLAALPLQLTFACSDVRFWHAVKLIGMADMRRTAAVRASQDVSRLQSALLGHSILGRRTARLARRP